MASHLQLGDLRVEVVRKHIKHIYLTVQPPDGRVRISAPTRLNLDTLRLFALSKLDWIGQQQRKLRDQARQRTPELLDREIHYLWGNRYLLQVIEGEGPACISLSSGKLLLRVKPGTEDEQRRELLAAWYRQQLKAAAVGLIAKWEGILGVKVQGLFIQRMKTRWGSCTPARGNIRLNTELAMKPMPCLEYIVVHELAHLIERRHNDRFRAIMDAHLPQWPAYRELLNRFPLAYEAWEEQGSPSWTVPEG